MKFRKLHKMGVTKKEKNIVYKTAPKISPSDIWPSVIKGVGYFI